MATVNLGGFEDLVRMNLKTAVDTFGFGGVLSLLADEASERVTEDDEATQAILDAIETAQEEVNEHEEPADDEAEDDDEEEFEQEDYIVEVDDDEEESDDDGDDESDEEEGR